MPASEIQTALYEFVLQQFPAARTRGLRVEDSLLEQGIVDSLGVLEIATFIEQHFEIVLSDDEMVSEHFSSIPALAEMVGQKLGAESPSGAV